MKRIELPQEYALVLWRLRASGEEDFLNLAESVRMDRRRLTHILENLQHKGLIALGRGRSRYNDAWIRLTSKGRRLFVANNLQYAM